MSFPLSIQDSTSAGEVLATAVLHFPVEFVSVRELIEARVEREVEQYHSEKGLSITSLVTPKDAEKTLNGFKVKRKKNIDLQEQQKVAIQAFENNGFFLLVNDRQLIELDEVIQITPNSNVVFLKLIPIVGG